MCKQKPDPESGLTHYDQDIAPKAKSENVIVYLKLLLKMKMRFKV